MEGADILKVASQRYASTVQYPSTSIAKKLKGIAQVHLANLGSRIFYCDHIGFDTHANQVGVHATLRNRLQVYNKLKNYVPAARTI
jgi:hypothetical protein